MTKELVTLPRFNLFNLLRFWRVSENSAKTRSSQIKNTLKRLQTIKSLYNHSQTSKPLKIHLLIHFADLFFISKSGKQFCSSRFFICQRHLLRGGTKKVLSTFFFSINQREHCQLFVNTFSF